MGGVQQTSIFEFLYDTYKCKHIHLYQFFAGIGSQAKALKKLGVDFTDYKIAEWSVPSIIAYNRIHTKEFTDYSVGKSREELEQVVRNVSLDSSSLITEKQLKSKSDEWIKNVYNNIKLCKLYYPPFNFRRTGCKGCPYSLDLQEQLEIMALYLPTERNQCEYIWKPVYDEYRKLNYRLKRVEQGKLF